MSSSLTDGPRQKRRKRQAVTRERGDTKVVDADTSVASAPAEIQISYEYDDGIRRQGEPRNIPEKDESREDPRNVSFQDQLAASALSGTIEFLKVAGGLTLNATGRVVAPPLHVTRTVLLPALWAASIDYISTQAPKRAKDWFRILSTSVHHIIGVLKETEKGKLFRQRLLILGGDLLDCLSADTTRQVLIDGMAGFVKLVEALSTAESKACLDQFTVLCCRLTQVAASGRSQQAMHDAKKLAWSGAELLADPHSTTALAEVTAYLCHALEMEDAILDGAHRSNQERSDRRKERNEYQKGTFQEKTTLMTNPNATVEQVILSSLGGPSGSEPPGCEDSDAFSSHDVPSDNAQNSENRVWSTDAGSIRRQVEESSFHTDDEWHEKAHNNVDITFLRDQISKRTNDRQSRNEDIPRDIPVVTTVTEASSPNPVVLPNSQKSQTAYHEAAGSGRLPLEEGEDALNRFYRVLDSVIKEKRSEGLDHILAEYAQSADKVLQEGKVRKFDHNNAGKDYQPHDIISDTVRSRLAAIRADVNKGLVKSDREKLQRMEVMMKENSKVAYLMMAAVIGFILLWIVLGCYGLYAFLSPSVHRAHTSIQKHFTPHVAHGSGGRPVAENEIVIRLVREVVHVDKKGIILDRNPDQTEISRERREKIAACMSDSLKDEE